MNFAESPSRIIYDYLMVSQTYTNSTFQALFLTPGIPQATLTAALLHDLRCMNQVRAKRNPVICLTDLNDGWIFYWREHGFLWCVKPRNRAQAVCICRFIVCNEGMPETDPAHVPDELPEQRFASDKSIASYSSSSSSG
jgi:hypothetical protein